VRWKSTAETIQQQTELLVGDVFLGAACIAYYGAFTGSYRQQLVAGWISVSRSGCCVHSTLVCLYHCFVWPMMPDTHKNVEAQLAAVQMQFTCSASRGTCDFVYCSRGSGTNSTRACCVCKIDASTTGSQL
jgi:hypothetical protein